MIRYEEIAVDAETELKPIPSGLSIYLEYYKKNIGWAARHVQFFVYNKLKPFYGKYDTELTYWPEGLVNYMNKNFFNPYPKTAGMRIIKQVLIPFALLNTMLAVLFYRCCCRRNGEKKVKEE